LELQDFVALAAVFVFAFLGAYIAWRRQQSLIVGYILAGVALGTLAAYWNPLGDGLFEDVASRQLSHPVQVIFDLGITFLMFFIGMEISLRRLGRAGRSATLVAVTDTGFNLFAGIIIGTIFGWGWQDIFFLSGIILMSSLSVAAKALIELRRLDNRETEFLLSAMVVEAFIAMVLLTLSTSVIVVTEESPQGGITEIAKAVAVVYVVLLILAMFVIPKLARKMETIRHEEIFILMVLTLIFSAAALSWSFGLPFMIGAFFMGIAFSETALTDRLRTRLLSMRDAFAAAFFIAFGMMIDLEQLFQAETIIMVILAVGFIFLNEMVFTASVSFFMGLGKREVINMGAALLGRGEDAILFASVGGGLKNADGDHLLPNGMMLYPFAGGLCLIMSLITPWIMKHSVSLADRMGRAVPDWLKFGGVLVQRTMAIELDVDSHRKHGHAVSLTITILLFFGCVMGLVATFKPADAELHWQLSVAGMVAWALLALSIRFRFRKFQEFIKVTGLNMLFKDRKMLVDYVSTTLSLLLLLGLGMVVVAPISVGYSLLLVPLGIGAVLFHTNRTHKKAVSPHHHLHALEMLEMQARASGKRLRKRRRDRKW
jgi:CPA2 family monovalent cation:H+ antiporter-2